MDKIQEQLRWLRQTVHQAHHEGPIEDCRKSTCTAFRDILTEATTGKGLPKIYVFCNTRCQGRGEWHSMVALAEDGAGLCGHLCSNHGWAMHDMGFTSSWKHEHYAKHYPGGYELVWVDDPEHPEKYEGLQQAMDLNRARPSEVSP